MSRAIKNEHGMIILIERGREIPMERREMEGGDRGAGSERSRSSRFHTDPGRLGRRPARVSPTAEAPVRPKATQAGEGQERPSKA